MSFPGSANHNYLCYVMQKYHLHTLVHILAASARTSPDPGAAGSGEGIDSARHEGLRRYGYRHPFAWSEPAMECRPFSAALGRRGGCVASGPGLPVQRHVRLAPRHLEGAGARDAASRAAKTAVAVVKPEL